MISDLQKKAAQAIVNIFETGQVQGDYGKVVYVPSDPGGLTYGRSQTTLNSGNLFLLMKAYVAQPNAAYGDELRPYLGRFESKSSSLNRDRTLRNILEDAGNDPVMQDTQDEFFDRVYWVPTVRSAEYIGVQTALGYAVVYDGRIHGSWHSIRDRTNKSYGSLNAIGEPAWISRYVQTRRNWLANHSIRILNKTVYRMDAFNQLINESKWDLSLPFTVRSFRVDQSSLSVSVPGGSANIAPERLLKVTNPYMRGEDVRLVQTALKKAGYPVDLDGIYGPGTAAQVTAFQQQNGLMADGIVGDSTRVALDIDEDPQNPNPPVSSSPTPQLLKLENPPLRGNDVRELQGALRNARMRVSTDGVFGPNTEQAVKDFQRSRGLVVDGIVGPSTRQALGLI